MARVKLIISGVPRSGKTYFGDWLRDVHGFAHANLEERVAGSRTVVPPASSFELAHWLGSLGENVVATWGFAPCPGWLELLSSFVDAGFTPWWFHCDYALARERYRAREGERKAADRFDPQIYLLERAADELEAFYGEHQIRTLTRDGYTPAEETYDLIAAISAENYARDCAAVRIRESSHDFIADAFARSTAETQRLIAEVVDY